MKPFITYSLDRYDDVALVKIVRITFNDDGQTYTRKVLEEYETLGRGATASAKRSVAKHENALNDRR
jgi:hypothetical protein